MIRRDIRINQEHYTGVDVKQINYECCGVGKEAQQCIPEVFFTCL